MHVLLSARGPLRSLRRKGSHGTNLVGIAVPRPSDWRYRQALLLTIDEAPFLVAAQGTTRCYGPGLNTLAGLCVNRYYQVLNANKDAVIPGLYAVGNTMGERYGNSYTGPSAGNNMGNAMTSGRVAGKHAAGAVDDIK